MNQQSKVHNLRQHWEKQGTKTLKMSKRPPVDLHNGVLKPKDEIIKNINLRLAHLAEVLELLHRIYHENKELYGDRFLAFVGNEVVREWPWKDYPLISEAALQLLQANESYEDITGYLPFEIKNKQTRAIFKQLRYEHWTPISFFRDVFHAHPPIDQETYCEILTNYYKVVWITREEDDRLNREHRSWRPEDTYQKLGINIVHADNQLNSRE